MYLTCVYTKYPIPLDNVPRTVIKTLSEFCDAR